MRGRYSRAARARARRTIRLERFAPKAALFALLLALAAPALSSGVRHAGTQSRKSVGQDEGAQGAKDKSAREAKDKKEKDAQEEKDDDAKDAKNEDKAETRVLIRPAPAVRLRPAPATQSRPAAPAATKPLPPAATSPAPTGQGKPAPTSKVSGAQPTAVPVSPVSVTEVSFEQLAKRAALAASGGEEQMQAIHPPLTINDSPAPAAAPKRPKMMPGSAPPAQDDTAGGPDVPSPAPSQSFLAQEDGPKIGGPSSGFFTIPPDTQGAVGLDKVFVNTNQNYRVQNKLTGAPLSTVSIDSFWSTSGGAGFFDPRITFDPYNQRWILAAASNAPPSAAGTSSIEVAVSQTADAQGPYFIYRFKVGCANGDAGCSTQGEWADFPMLGFNKNWIAVSMNMFGVSDNSFIEGRVLVIDYPTARAGTLVPGDLNHSMLFTNGDIGFCLHPVETYDPNQSTLFLAQHLTSASATYDLATITGTPATPVLATDPALLTGGRVRPGGAWVQPGGDILPQTCTGTAGVTCPNSLRFMDVGDAQVRGNAVFRNDHIYYTQTVGLPAGSMTHTAAQWTELNADGTFADGGRVEDPSATSTNGGKWYAYSSIAVNKNNDFLVGFSQFASNQFASSAYAYHDHTDAAGTTRAPAVFKAGEDYYAKTFNGSRNRWGDYSHTLVDPSNDTDLWTIQEYAQQRVAPDSSSVTNNSRWGTWWAKLALGAGAGDLVISEFRLRGPGGPNDEYVEIYNASGHDITVSTTDGSAGYGLFASDAALRFTIPAGTTIPARGHYLGVNSGGYSLKDYGGTNAAAGDATFTTDIADNVGIALFGTSNPNNLPTATRFDAVGSTDEPNPLFKEGGGYPAVTATNLNYAFVRDACGKGGSTSMPGPCTTGGLPKDTGDNASDFFFVDTTGTDAGAGARLGAPGPENASSPVQRNDSVAVSLLDPAAGQSNPPNRVRDFDTSDAQRASLGHLAIRRTVTNNTGRAVTRLRFRVVDVSAFPAPLGTADLRVLTSGTTPITVNITGTNPACPSNNCPVQQTTLETPPAQSAGGAFNSSLSVGTVALAQPIPPGGTINVQLLLGVRQPGNFRILVNVEALP